MLFFSFLFFFFRQLVYHPTPREAFPTTYLLLSSWFKIQTQKKLYLLNITYEESGIKKKHRRRRLRPRLAGRAAREGDGYNTIRSDERRPALRVSAILGRGRRARARATELSRRLARPPRRVSR